MTKNRGRPSLHSTKAIANRVLRTTLPSHRTSSPLSLSRFWPSTVALESLQCGVCHNIVDQPMHTECRKLVCATCIPSLLHSSENGQYNCPSCKEPHKICASTFPEASDVVVNVLGDLLVRCEEPNCIEVVALKNLKKHVASGCVCKVPTFSPSKMTVSQILSRPLTSPPTTAEKKVATTVVKRIIASDQQASQPDMVQLPTAGQVSKV